MKTLQFLGIFLLLVLAILSAEGVCLAKHERNSDTAAINNNGKSCDYGIFQINSQYWCDDGKTQGSKNICDINCREFLDGNISDDIKCVKTLQQMQRA
ncbi:lysozyme C-like [Liasis olivaceus]